MRSPVRETSAETSAGKRPRVEQDQRAREKGRPTSHAHTRTLIHAHSNTHAHTAARSHTLWPVEVAIWLVGLAIWPVEVAIWLVGHQAGAVLAHGADHRVALHLCAPSSTRCASAQLDALRLGHQAASREVISARSSTPMSSSRISAIAICSSSVCSAWKWRSAARPAHRSDLAPRRDLPRPRVQAPLRPRAASRAAQHGASRGRPRTTQHGASRGRPRTAQHGASRGSRRAVDGAAMACHPDGALAARASPPSPTESAACPARPPPPPRQVRVRAGRCRRRLPRECDRRARVGAVLGAHPRRRLGRHRRRRGRHRSGRARAGPRRRLGVLHQTAVSCALSAAALGAARTQSDLYLMERRVLLVQLRRRGRSRSDAQRQLRAQRRILGALRRELNVEMRRDRSSSSLRRMSARRSRSSASCAA